MGCCLPGPDPLGSSGSWQGGPGEDRRAGPAPASAGCSLPEVKTSSVVFLSPTWRAERVQAAASGQRLEASSERGPHVQAAPSRQVCFMETVPGCSQ